MEGSKQFIPGGFSTMTPKQANDVQWDDDSAPTQMPLPLPYDEIEVIQNRDVLRDTIKNIGGKMGRQLMMIPLNQLSVREGFNWREKPADMSDDQWLYDPNELDIKGLAEGLWQSDGVFDPIEIDLTPDGFGVITDGFRRYKAMTFLMLDGRVSWPISKKRVDLVEVLINPKEMSELDRMARIFTSQNNKKLKPLELARGLQRMKITYGLSNEELGRRCGGQSRQWVDNKLNLLKEDMLVQAAIEDGTFNQTDVINLRHQVKSETERAAIMQEALENKESPKVPAVSKQERKEKQENQLQFEFNDNDLSQDQRDAIDKCNSGISKCDQLRHLHKGLNDQAAKDADQKLDWIIQDLESAREFIRSSHKR